MQEELQRSPSPGRRHAAQVNTCTLAQGFPPRQAAPGSHTRFSTTGLTQRLSGTGLPSDSNSLLQPLPALSCPEDAKQEATNKSCRCLATPEQEKAAPIHLPSPYQQDLSQLFGQSLGQHLQTDQPTSTPACANSMANWEPVKLIFNPGRDRETTKAAENIPAPHPASITSSQKPQRELIGLVHLSPR